MQLTESSTNQGNGVYVVGHCTNCIYAGCVVIFCKRDRAKCPCYKDHKDNQSSQENCFPTKKTPWDLFLREGAY